MGRSKWQEYAMYKGEECLAVGTAQEIADKLNIKLRTVYWLSMPAYIKRIKARKYYDPNNNKAKICIRLN